MASSCSPSYVLLLFVGPTLKLLWLFFSCRPVSFASISALCGTECNKSCVKQINLVTSWKHCFLQVKLVTTAFLWKKCIIEKNFQYQYLVLELNFSICCNNTVPKTFKYFFRIYKLKKYQRAKHKKTAIAWRVDSSWTKAAIKRPEKMEKQKEFSKQKHFFYFKRTRNTAGNQDK